MVYRILHIPSGKYVYKALYTGRSILGLSNPMEASNSGDLTTFLSEDNLYKVGEDHTGVFLCDCDPSGTPSKIQRHEFEVVCIEYCIYQQHYM